MSDHRRYKLKDHRFGLLALTLREKAGLVQARVASVLGVSERSVGHWEAGTTYPTFSNLKELIKLYMNNGAFAKGHEREEAKAFWELAAESASRRLALFDEVWFDELLRQQQRGQEQKKQHESETHVSHTPSLLQGTDWGEALDVTTFCGREQELLTLKQWVEHERCRVVMVHGMGGIGKTTLAIIRFAQEMAPYPGFVLWRSLRHAPPLEELVTDCLQTLSGQESSLFLHHSEKKVTLLVELLRKQRCLLVLDNVETLLQPGNLEGRYRRGYEDYGRLFQQVAQTMHQSCLLLTSREMLSELDPLEGTHAPVRVLKLAGLGQTASQDLLADKDLFGDPNDWQAFIEQYSGNPLILKIVAATVRDLFGGDLAAFFRADPGTLQTLRQLLEQQFTRLVPLERDIMYWQAIERDLVSLETLRADLPEGLSSQEVLSALQALRRRSLVERGEQGATFTLQPEVMAYVSERLVEQICEEIIQVSPRLFLTHALLKAHSQDYLRESQVRLLIQPVMSRLLMHFGSEQKVELQLLRLVRLLQQQPAATQGYGGGNLVNLLAHLKGHLKGLDFSALTIRQAYLQGIEAQDANFAGARLIDTVLMEPIENSASMALSPDGRYLAVGSFSGQIRVWRVAERKALLTWQGQSRVVWALAFSPDSTLLASGGYGGKVMLWDIQGEDGPGGQCLSMSSGQERWIHSLAFSPDGTLLASADDELIHLWDTRKRTCLQILRGHRGVILSIAFSPDSTLLISGALDETVRVWDVHHGTCLNVLHGHIGMVTTLAFQPSGDIFVSGNENGQFKLWDTAGKHCLNSFHLRTPKAASIAFNREGTLFAVGRLDGAVEVWQLTEKKSLSRLRTLPGHATGVSTVAFGPDNLLASISYGGKVKLWDAESGRCLETLQGYSHVIYAVSFSPDGKWLVHGDDHGMIHVWDGESGSCFNVFQAHAGRILSLAFSPDGKTIASSGDDQITRLWKMEGKREEEDNLCLRAFEDPTMMLWALAFSPDGSLLASSGSEQIVKVWKVHKAEKEATFTSLEGHATFTWSLAFSPDGRRIATGGEDGMIRIWEVERGQCLTLLQHGHRPIGALVFSPDGNMLLSSSNDETTMVWDLRREGESRELLRSQGHVSWTKALAFSQDGTMLASGSDDHTISIWQLEMQSGTSSLRIFSRQGGQVWALAFSPDNRLLASGDNDGTLVLWDVQTGTYRQVLRSDRPYERMNIHGVKGITPVQRRSLKALGAIEEDLPE